MKKALFILLTLLLAVPASQGLHAQSWRRVSREIRNQQILMLTDSTGHIFKDDKKSLRKYHRYRRRLAVFDSLKVDVRGDTIFLLELGPYDVWDYRLGGTIYSRKGFLTYGLHKESDDGRRIDSLIVDNKPCDPKVMMKLVAKWDLEGLREEERLHGNWIPPEYTYATRVIFKDGQYKVECIYFKTFYFPPRDDLDYYYYDYEMKDVHELLDELFK